MNQAPLKAKVHAARTKHMDLTFFDGQGMIYRHTFPRDSSVNAAYIAKILLICLKLLMRKTAATAIRTCSCTGTMPRCTMLPSCASGWQSTRSQVLHIPLFSRSVFSRLAISMENGSDLPHPKLVCMDWQWIR